MGYGLEGPLNDATAKRIISDTIAPRFRTGDFSGGLTAGVEQILRVVDGEALPAPVRQSGGRQGSGIGSIQEYVPVIFIVALVVGGFLRAILGRFPGALVTGGVVAAVAWFVVGAISIAAIAGVIAMVFTLLGGGIGGRGIGGLGGGSGSGGYSGGGGSFGGGGASGRW